MAAGPFPYVLIIDDDADTRLAIRTVLEDSGYSVLEVAAGADALAQLRISAARLVVLVDLLMPDMDGQQVLETVAADERLTTAHAYILMTAAPLDVATPLTPSLDELLVRLRIPVLPKPFDIDQLLTEVEAAVARLG